MKRFVYKDDKITHKNRVYYLRTKYARRGGECVLTIRTHENGKGQNLAEVKGVISDNTSQIKLLHKLNKKFKFKYLIETDIQPIPQ